MFTFEWFSCPDGITPNSGLTGPNNTIYIYICGGAHGVMVIVVGIEHDDTSSNPGRD